MSSSVGIQTSSSEARLGTLRKALSLAIPGSRENFMRYVETVFGVSLRRPYTRDETPLIGMALRKFVEQYVAASRGQEEARQEEAKNVAQESVGMLFVESYTAYQPFFQITDDPRGGSTGITRVQYQRSLNLMASDIESLLS